jgi:hypothetical protein
MPTFRAGSILGCFLSAYVPLACGVLLDPQRPRRLAVRELLEVAQGEHLVDLSTPAAFGEYLREELQMPVVNMLDAPVANRVSPVTLRFEDETLRVALTAAADVFDVVFVFRDYGILITTPKRAATMSAATFPEDLSLE